MSNFVSEHDEIVDFLHFSSFRAFQGLSLNIFEYITPKNKVLHGRSDTAVHYTGVMGFNFKV